MIQPLSGANTCSCWLQELERHLMCAKVMREGIAKHGGYEINTEGDAFQVAFTSVHQVCVRPKKVLLPAASTIDAACAILQKGHCSLCKCSICRQCCSAGTADALPVAGERLRTALYHMTFRHIGTGGAVRLETL